MDLNPEITKAPAAPELQTSVKEAIAALKEDVETTQRAREFLKENSFDLEIETRLGSMNLTPDLPQRKVIYERMLFGQKNASKIILEAELAKTIKANPNSSDADLIAAAKNIIDSWFATIAKLDKNLDGKLNYEELVPDDEAEKDFVERVFGTAPFFIAMQSNDFFQDPETDVEKDIKNGRINFVKNYVANFAETLIDPKSETKEAITGAGRELARLLQAISLGVVGGRFLKNEDFATAWSELLEENESIATVFSEGEKQNEQEKFERLLEKDSVAIRKMRASADQKLTDLLQHEKSNPYGFMTRKFGDMSSVLLYFAKDMLIGTVALNAVLSGFSLQKMVKNPVMWATLGGIFAAKKHFDPDFLNGTTEDEKNSKNELKEKIAAAEPPVSDWLGLFSKSDLNIESKLMSSKTPLGLLLTEPGRNEITSAELKKILSDSKRKDEIPQNEIGANSNEAHQLFLLLRACQQRDLSPKSVLDV